jgi:hypothetical protein
LSSSSSSQTHKRQNTQKNNKKKPKKGRSLPSISYSTLSFLAPAFALSLQVFFPGIFFFTIKKKKKKHKEKKTIEKKIYVEKGKRLPSSSHSAFSLLALTYALSLLHFCFKCFVLALFSSQAK